MCVTAVEVSVGVTLKVEGGIVSEGKLVAKGNTKLHRLAFF